MGTSQIIPKTVPRRNQYLRFIPPKRTRFDGVGVRTKGTGQISFGPRLDWGHAARGIRWGPTGRGSGRRCGEASRSVKRLGLRDPDVVEGIELRVSCCCVEPFQRVEVRQQFRLCGQVAEVRANHFLGTERWLAPGPRAHQQAGDDPRGESFTVAF